MISVKSLVRLGLSVDTGCTKKWSALAQGGLRRRPRVPHVHLCVGNFNHLGKHVCPCGASVRVGS